MEQIRKYFEQQVKLSDDDWKMFASKLSREEYPSKYLLLRAGQTEDYLSFVARGILRFYIPEEEKDLTFSFVFHGNFVSAYDSFLTRTPSSYHVETLTKTTLWRLSWSSLQAIYQESKAGQTIGRLASETLFLRKSRRELSLLKDSAEQRYLTLLEEQPELIRQIPLKYIASYIGITPQALSRIRKRIS
jgi:CRP-like cAMP-binding protein